MRFFLSIAAVVIVVGGASVAADLAVLRNGNSIRHEHREIRGELTRLYLGTTSAGYVEIPSDQIDHFEKDTSPPPDTAKVSSPPSSNVALMPQPKEPLTPEALDQLVTGAGTRHQIDPDFIRSVIKAESGFHQNAVSRKGALGLMQLMPDTASDLGVRNPFDPHANVEGGTKYLRDLLVKYNFDVNKALAAYNAGPNRVDQYNGVPPYSETREYISRIIRDFNRQKIAENPELAKKLTGNARQNRTRKTPRASKAAAPQKQSSSVAQSTATAQKGPSQ